MSFELMGGVVRAFIEKLKQWDYDSHAVTKFNAMALNESDFPTSFLLGFQVYFVT